LERVGFLLPAGLGLFAVCHTIGLVCLEAVAKHPGARSKTTGRCRAFPCKTAPIETTPIEPASCKTTSIESASRETAASTAACISKRAGGGRDHR
jgi:hypothetical protein